jgi:hypothetical protein
VWSFSLARATVSFCVLPTASADGLAVFMSLPDSWMGSQDDSPPDALVFEFERSGDQFRFEAKLPEEVSLFVVQQIRMSCKSTTFPVSIQGGVVSCPTLRGDVDGSREP